MRTEDSEDVGLDTDPAGRLFEALYGDDDDAVVRALRAGAPAEATDEDGQTALYTAAARDRPGMVRLLLAAGADPDRASGAEGAELPLCGTAVWGHTEAMRALLAAGAQVDLAEEPGVRALIWACREGRAEVVELLLAAGADPDLPGPDGQPPLVTATRRGSPSCVRALLRCGASAAAEALAEARRWAGTDVAAELRRGLAEVYEVAESQVETRRVEEDGGETVIAEVVRDGRHIAGNEQQTGHTAIATLLEDALGMRTPAEELAGRALRRGDPDLDDWTEAVAVLQRRGDEETFRAAAGWAGTGDALRQTFAADVLAGLGHTDGDGVGAGAGVGQGVAARVVPLLRELARESEEPEVIRAAVTGLGRQGDPAGVTEILRHAGHPDPEVRFGVAVALHGLVPGDHTGAVEAVLGLTRDGDDGVRDWATAVLADVEADGPEIRDALAARLADPVPDIEAEAARGLAMRQDGRAVEALARILADEDPEGYAYSMAEQAVEYVTDERVRLRLEATLPRSR
ncbi:ankyrin repeat domain-containing protein [Streptomyces sp. FIT100]|uniref:ankyrin repeat domain-containing protein n=1 Tax=Streptomyces sp. FIT100 TaxID=2837956 RepID=UPI0021C9C074|nr:ankyrin repeat domain-containing protein [Streptomyces sp. FIT100]UUN26292.1 ankyrin repeat domain-containing protein [Streptomyces sp. FIT100]